jgi:transposase
LVSDSYHNKTGKVVFIMRPARVFTDVPVGARAQIMDLLHGRWRTATRLMMVVLSAAGMSAAEIADLLDYHPATVRRWLHRFAIDGIPGLPDRPRSGRPPLGGPTLTPRIAALLAAPGPWTIRRIWLHLGRPAISLRALYRRTHAAARWRRPAWSPKATPTTTRSAPGSAAGSFGYRPDPSSSPKTKPTSTYSRPCAPPGPCQDTATTS